MRALKKETVGIAVRDAWEGEGEREPYKRGVPDAVIERVGAGDAVVDASDVGDAVPILAPLAVMVAPGVVGPCVGDSVGVSAVDGTGATAAEGRGEAEREAVKVKGLAEVEGEDDVTESAERGRRRTTRRAKEGRSILPCGAPPLLTPALLRRVGRGTQRHR